MIFKKFKSRFIKRVMTRFHMSLILFCTIISGVLFSKIYLELGMEGIASRYLLVLVSAYLIFLLLIKIWLNYLTKNRSLAEDILDEVDSIPDAYDLTAEGLDSASAACENVSSAVETVGSNAQSVGDGAAEVAGEAVLGFADEGAIVLIPFAILFLVIFGAGAYLIYEAPVILSEAAFEFLLASSLIKGAKRVDNPDWMGSVFRATWIPLVITALVVVIAARIATSYCPDLVSIKELYDSCF